MSLSTFTLLPTVSRAHFQQSNLISQHDVYTLTEARALNRLNILHILRGGPSHRLTVKSRRWLHKWKIAEVSCFQQQKYVLWTKHGCRRLPDITKTVRQDLNQRLRNSSLWIQCFVFHSDLYSSWPTAVSRPKHPNLKLGWGSWHLLKAKKQSWWPLRAENF